MKFLSVLPFLLVGACVIIGSVEARPQQLQKRAEQNEGLESSAEDDLKGAASSYSFEYYPDTYPYTYRYRYSNPYYGYYRYGGMIQIS